MKAVILSAGYGSRLLPLTLEIPKCLVPVKGREILLHQLDALAIAGVTQATIVVGYRHRQIEEFAAARSLPLTVSLVFNPFWSVANSIGSLWVAREHLVDPFCLLNGDTIFDAEVLAGALNRSRGGMGLLVEPTAGSELDDMRVEVNAGQVTAVAKDLPESRTTHRSLGVVISNGADGAYRHALGEVIAREDGPGSYHHAVVAQLAETIGVEAIERDAGYWREIDRPEDIETWNDTHRQERP